MATTLGATDVVLVVGEGTPAAAGSLLGVDTEVGTVVRPVTSPVGITSVVGLPQAASKNTSARVDTNAIFDFFNRGLSAIGGTAYLRCTLL